MHSNMCGHDGMSLVNGCEWVSRAHSNIFLGLHTADRIFNQWFTSLPLNFPICPAYFLQFTSCAPLNATFKSGPEAPQAQHSSSQKLVTLQRYVVNVPFQRGVPGRQTRLRSACLGPHFWFTMLLALQCLRIIQNWHSHFSELNNCTPKPGTRSLILIRARW